MTALVALGAGLLRGWSHRPPAPGRRRCSTRAAGSSGRTPPYTFAAVLDTDVPATLPYGPQRTTRGRPISSCRGFRSWAVSQGYKTVYAGEYLDTALDGVAQPQMYQSAPGSVIPTTPQTYTWTATSTSTVSASALGHHAFSVTGLTITVAFQDAGGNNILATSATCALLDPAADTVVDGYDVVAASTTTSLAVKGDTATATVISNGTPPVGIVTFTVGGRSWP